MRLSYEEFKAIVDTTPNEDLLTRKPFLERVFQSVVDADALKAPVYVTQSPYRRAELLELASRLAVADRPKLDSDDLLVTGNCDGFELIVERVIKQKAHVIVTQAAAIIAEVDRVSGEVKNG